MKLFGSNDFKNVEIEKKKIGFVYMAILNHKGIEIT
jgi:hypothetical protein